MSDSSENKNPFAQVFISFTVMCVGFYMLLEKITIKSSLAMGKEMFRIGQATGGGVNVSVTSGMIFVPMILGIGLLFYNPKSIWGWLIAGVSGIAMILGVIMNTKIEIQTMSSFELITILVLAFGGLGWFLRSSKNFA